jgi:hypothetical protein
MAVCMLLQAVILVAGVAVTLLGSVAGMFGVLALMGAQGALLSPAREGAIPESVRKDAVPAANGVVGLAAVAAAVVGTVAGNEPYVLNAPRGRAHWYVLLFCRHPPVELVAVGAEAAGLRGRCN